MRRYNDRVTTISLEQLLARPGRPVLLDGAVGTELARRGIPTTLPLWSAHALLTDAGLTTLTQIHADYARAGAEILVTNTFRTTRRGLAKGDLGDAGNWQELNRRAVAAARAGLQAARSGPAALDARRVCLVAGGLAPLEDCYRPDLVPSETECLAEHRRQAECLARLGVDLIMIETMNSLREARAALAAALETGLEILLSLCPKGPRHLLSGEPLDEVIPRLRDQGGPRLRGLLLNCATPEVLEPLFPAFVALSPELPHGLYAHLGEPDDVTGWRLPDHHEPERYARWVSGRIDEGARLVGGCCGTIPDHIAALARLPAVSRHTANSL